MTRRPRFIVGIPTVQRERPYLLETVDSVLGGMRPSFDRASLVVFDGDVAAHPRDEIRALSSRYAGLCRSGALVLANRRQTGPIEACSEKSRWQRKQALDCATLLELCNGHADYYLHLEDDVIASPGFLDAIDARLDEHDRAGRRWSILSFYNAFEVEDGTRYSEYRLTKQYFGFIGQLFLGNDLASLAAYIHAHYKEGPIDALVARWALAGGRVVIAHTPSLFQHVGVVSSFQSRIQLWDSPEFIESDADRRKRLAVSVRDIRVHQPEASRLFLRYRRQIRQVQRSARASSEPASNSPVVRADHVAHERLDLKRSIAGR